MRRREQLSQALMRLGSLISPKEDYHWILAIRGEASERNADQLEWAWGCFVTSLDRRLQQDGGLLVAILLTALLAYLSVFLLMFGIGMSLGEKTLNTVGYAIDWGPVALGSAVLSMWRPKKWIFIALVLPVLTEAVSLISFASYFHTPLSQIPSVHLMDARLDVGLGAEVGYAFLGALCGLAVSQTRSISKA